MKVVEATEAVRIKKASYDIIRESCKKTGVSVSFYVNRAVNAYIESGELQAIENALLDPFRKKPKGD